MSIINTATSTFVWENVANYDFTFRHLIAFNPTRSWAKTYSQMWNLSMKDPIPKHSYGSGGNKNFQSIGGVGTSKMGGHGQGSGGPQSGKKKKAVYCWFLTVETFASTERNAVLLKGVAFATPQIILQSVVLKSKLKIKNNQLLSPTMI